MNNFSFIQNPSGYINEDGFVTLIEEGLHTQQDLLEEISHKLYFPSYFGFNMDALSDCLRDLSWISEYKVILIHSDVPEIEVQELKIYLEVLDDAVSDWKGSETHSLKVLFPMYTASYLHSLEVNQ